MGSQAPERPTLGGPELEVENHAGKRLATVDENGGRTGTGRLPTRAQSRTGSYLEETFHQFLYARLRPCSMAGVVLTRWFASLISLVMKWGVQSPPSRDLLLSSSKAE
jgi:hypothetical protein